MIVLKPFIQHDLGLMMFKPGKSLLDELIRMGNGNRLMLMSLPKELVNVPSGKVNYSSIPNRSTKSLMEDDRLLEFFLNAEVQKKFDSFYHWLKRIPHCQLSDGEFCDKNLTFLDCKQGAVRLCWHHDNKERANPSDQLEILSKNNVLAWGILSVSSSLNFKSGHHLTLPELCWWAVKHGVYSHLPSSIVDQMFDIKPVKKSNYLIGRRESDLRFEIDAKELLANKAQQVKFIVDDCPPAMYMKRPKEQNWRNEKYLKFIRSLPCCVTGRDGSAVDPVVAHHLIGHCEGKMGGKAHDLFTMPILASEHQKLHHDPKAWEVTHDSQLFYVKQTIKKALDLGALI